MLAFAVLAISKGLGGQTVRLPPATAVYCGPGKVVASMHPHTVVMRCRYALVNPVPGTSHLKVADEGIQLLNSIEGPVAPIVVIGPYRSGKSFLLNQLLGVPCSETPAAAPIAGLASSSIPARPCALILCGEQQPRHLPLLV